MHGALGIMTELSIESMKTQKGAFNSVWIGAGGIRKAS